jgi:P4 family phage/plasmid primase-like protien
MALAAHIKKLYALLGADAVLIPAAYGEKRPLLKSWQDTSWAETQTDDYQAQVAEGNVGVVLCGNGTHLCAIDIDDDQDMEPFFELNPALRTTLITRGARGCQIWLHIVEDPKYSQLQLPRHPAVKALKFRPGFRDRENPANGDLTPGQFGEWRADGGQSIIYGRHPDGHDYSFINEAPAIRFRFRDIRWPKSIELPWNDMVDQALIRIYGDPWVADNNGEPKQMIEPYWAGLFAYRHEVVYDKDEERFYLYDPRRGLWERATDQDVSYRGTQMLLEVSREAGHPVLQGPRFRGSAKLAAVGNHLKGIVGRRGIFEKKRGLIHLKNGMIDLTEAEDGALRLMPHSPDYFSRNQIPVAFDGDAQCPTFLTKLLGAGLGEEDIALMQRWGGLLLLQDNMFQKIMILTGTAGGGKSTVMSVFQKMVGQDNCAQLRTEQLLERFEMAGFIGKSTLIGADVPGNFLMQRGAYKLKQLTGGDFFQAEIKTARDLVTLYGNLNVGITCNSRLRITMDSDAGAWDRRLVIIKYEAPKPEKPINNFADWLVEHEGPGILNWMIEGALELLESKKFAMSEQQRANVTDLLEESDSIRSFLRRCVIPAGRDSDVTTDELIEAYHEFCDSRSWDAIPAGSLEKHLPNLMLELYRANKNKNVKRDGTGRRGYTRVKLIKPDDESTIYDEEENFTQGGLITDDPADSYGKEDL